MKLLMCKKPLGFTLIEMVVVIIILGVLAAGISTFITLSTKIYTEATDRDQLVSSARFAIERLNREVRNALPNSSVVSGKCLMFSPIVASTIYTDIPVSPEAARNTVNVINVVEFDDPSNINDWSVIVYPLKPEDVYVDIGKLYPVASIGAGSTVSEKVITLDVVNNVKFSEDSPTQRLYFINGSVEYCIQNNRLLRRDSLDRVVLMARDIDNTSSFEVLAPTLQRNAIVQMHLIFNKNSEQVSFRNDVQVLNVP